MNKGSTETVIKTATYIEKGGTGTYPDLEGVVQSAKLARGQAADRLLVYREENSLDQAASHFSIRGRVGLSNTPPVGPGEQVVPVGGRSDGNVIAGLYPGPFPFRHVRQIDCLRIKGPLLTSAGNPS